MTVTLGILALLEAKLGRGGELAAFLKAGRELAVAEEGTVTWYAFKIRDTSYGILDTFAADDARTAHLNGQIPAALANVSADLLATPPEIRLVGVLAVKQQNARARASWPAGSADGSGTVRLGPSRGPDRVCFVIAVEKAACRTLNFVHNRC